MLFIGREVVPFERWYQEANKHCLLPFFHFVAVINVLLSICHIGSGTPNLRIFVEDIVALLDA